MSNYLRNPYDKSIIEGIFTEDLINRCISESVNKNYKLIPDWQKFLEKENFNDLIDGSKEDSNMKKFNWRITKSIIYAIEELTNRDAHMSGFFIYPPTGYMGWHTNYKNPGKRLYVTYASEDKKSFFRYRNPETKEIITDYDDKGFTTRQFDITDKPPYFWHCVGSDCTRVSFGYHINASPD